jgi:hypothetical protein
MRPSLPSSASPATNTRRLFGYGRGVPGAGEVVDVDDGD